ncbi:stalk domain-containing protein [Paenibacillus thermotolerans]|uniref:stalk domain-containing protein n=1 Tax=Paenibacillus thermotolerans TaxID=3027807 RepID=UPI002367A212|nr:MULTISPECIES: stalk domain-containing protein [unclassified Paenibacillus]
MKKWLAALCLVTSIGLGSAAGDASTAAAAAGNIQSYGADYLMKSDGTFWVWGNYYTVPTQVQGLTDVKASIGGQFVVKNDGTVWRWERNAITGLAQFELVDGVTDAVSVYNQYPDMLFLNAEGKLYRMPQDRSYPAEEMTGIDNVKEIAGYYNYKSQKQQWLLVKKDGSVWTSTDSFHTFVQVTSADHAVDARQNIILKEDGTVWTFPNEYDPDTVKDPSDDNDPITAVPVEGLKGIASIHYSSYALAAVDRQARLWFWGRTVSGFSDGTTYHKQAAPILMSGIKNVKDAYIVERFIIALTNDGKLYGGSIETEKLLENQSFELLASDVESIVPGGRQIIMQKTDGTLWGWGINKNGELGYGDYEIMYYKPVPMKPPVSIVLNGKPVALSNGAILLNGQAFIPVRSIFEQLGATVTWDNTAKIATVTRKQEGMTPVEITVNYKTGEIKLNGEAVELPNKPISSASISYLPLRFISESLGAKVDWFQAEQKIAITME